jgi:hypothetical protein
VGHTPTDDLPGVVKDENINLVLGDISYSKKTNFAPISIDLEKITVQGELEGQPTIAEVSSTSTSTSNLIGSLVDDQRIVAQYQNTGDYIGWNVDAEAGFKSKYTSISLHNSSVLPANKTYLEKLSVTN